MRREWREKAEREEGGMDGGGDGRGSRETSRMALFVLVGAHAKVQADSVQSRYAQSAPEIGAMRSEETESVHVCPCVCVRLRTRMTVLYFTHTLSDATPHNALRSVHQHHSALF